MKLDKIKNILSDYNLLLKRAEEKIEVIQKYDPKYDTLYGIEQITFEDNLVHVVFHDCPNDTDSFSFPIEWLCYEDDFELAEIVFAEKIKRDEKLLEAKKQHELKLKEESEKKDIETYLKLKEKYGSVHGL